MKLLPDTFRSEANDSHESKDTKKEGQPTSFPPAKVSHYLCYCRTSDGSTIVRIATRRSPHGRNDWHQATLQHPSALTWRKTRRKQPVIDFPGDGETVERCGRQEQARVIAESVGSRIDVTFNGGDYSVAVRVDASHFVRIGMKQALGEIVLVRHERGTPHVDIQQNLIGEPAGNESLPEFALRRICLPRTDRGHEADWDCLLRVGDRYSRLTVPSRARWTAAFQFPHHGGRPERRRIHRENRRCGLGRSTPPGVLEHRLF